LSGGEVTDLAELPDEALVLLSQRRDRAAFEQLVRRTGRLVWSRLYLETGSADRADDLAQETFLAAWRSVGQVTQPAGFRAWLMSICHNIAVDTARRESRQKRSGAYVPGDALNDLPHPDPEPPEAAERNEERRRVMEVLQSLPEEYRQVLMLRYLGGADYQEIGRQLGLTNGSLRGLLNRGMGMLREKMKD
jgi:RNA polymerase sigma-70 factor (ECF subfamily)